MKKINAGIITIGDELLIGQVVDTNSAWLGQSLNELGVWVNSRIAVGDVKEDIINALDISLQQSDLVIITGGLGPTADDITKPLLCEYFGGELIMNEDVKEHVVAFFERRKRPILDVNVAQARVPDVCEVLWNQYGTAPGMLFTKNNKLIFSLPGVPLEMKDIMTTSGFAKITKHYATPKISHRTLVTAGKGESFIAETLRDFENSLPTEIKLAYLPKLAIVRLRLTSVDGEEAVLEKYFLELQKILGPIVIATQDEEIEETVNKRLLGKKQTLAIAESCTGGAIANRITNISGASKILNGSIVCYTNDVKINDVGVSATLIEKYSEVSEEVVKDMATAIRKKLKADWGLSITGYLEHTDPNLKGKVYIGLAQEKETFVYENILPYDRIRSKELAVNLALNFLLSKLG